MAAIAPRISYQGGQLTVEAENTNLSDILNGIRVATGLKIETVGGAGGERVAAKIGPASVRDVLLSLLQGSRYDFIMMGSSTDPDRIERVVLTPKSTAAAGLSASNAPRPATPPAQEVVQEENETENSDDNAGFAPPSAQPGPPQNPQQPGAAVNPAQPAAQPDAQQGVKTPEQLLQDLRNMQQQQQQQQQTPPTSPDQVQRPPRTSRPQ
jgi:hypothetical protein